jgi:hypothetical protein
MPGVDYIKYKGKAILFIDFEGCVIEQELIAIIKKTQQLIIEKNEEYLQLANMKGVYATPKFMKEAKKAAQETPKLAKKRAIVGVDSHSRKIMLQAYNLVLGSQVRSFRTLKEAMDWLVQ